MAVPGPEDRRDVVLLDDLDRPRRGDDPPPPAAGVPHESPSFRPEDDDLLLRRIRGPDRLRRLLERRVRGIDDDLRHDARDGPRGAPCCELVVEGLLEEVPDLGLGFRDAHVQGHRGHAMAGLLVLDQDVPDLGAVPVRYDEREPRLDEVREAGRGLRDVGLHRGQARVLRRGDRVAADGDDSEVHRFPWDSVDARPRYVNPCPSVSGITI